MAFRPHRKAENALCGHLTRKNFPAALLSLIDGDEVGMKPASKRDIAFVFQMLALYPHMNVRKNISYPLISQGMTREEVSKRMAEVARIRRIEHIIDKPVGGLSGGDRQRAALGRAIVRQPKAFFMDEPLGELDAEFREHMAEELRALHDCMGATTVYVTHDQLGAMQMGDKIVVMHHGVVEQFGKPQQIYDWPATKFVVQFIGSSSMNFLDFEGVIGIGGDGVDLAGVRLAVPSVREGRAGRLTLGVRPEHVKFRDDAAYRGRVTAVEYLGTTQILTLSTGHGDLKARISSGYKVREEELVGLDFDARTLTLFDADNGKALVSEANEGVLGNG